MIVDGSDTPGYLLGDGGGSPNPLFHPFQLGFCHFQMADTASLPLAKLATSYAPKQTLPHGFLHSGPSYGCVVYKAEEVVQSEGELLYVTLVLHVSL